MNPPENRPLDYAVVRDALERLLSSYEAVWKGEGGSLTALNRVDAVIQARVVLSATPWYQINVETIEDAERAFRDIYTAAMAGRNDEVLMHSGTMQARMKKTREAALNSTPAARGTEGK